MKFTRYIALWVTEPTARLYSKNINSPNLVKISTIESLEEYVCADKESATGSDKIVSSVVIFTCLSDNLPDLQKIRDYLENKDLLVTTIVLNEKRCNKSGETNESLAELRRVSDMLIFTSDNSYLEYLLDCIS